jgi:hypothetical protein
MAVAVGAVMGAAACGRGSAEPDSTVLPSPFSEPEPVAAGLDETSGSPPASPSPQRGGIQLTETLTLQTTPLNEFSERAAAFLLTRAPQWGVTVILPERGRAYVANAQEPFALASLAKIPIMLTFLQRTLDAGRLPDEEEMALLTAMVTESDNDAAYEIWLRAGEGEGVASFLAASGVRGIEPPRSDDHWGDTTGTPAALGQLLGKLYAGAILDTPTRALALDLMSNVVDGQRWGVTAAFPDGREPGLVGLKNGWYPALTGWRVTSAAIGLSPGVEPMILVVMARNQDSFEYAVDTIEGVAALIGSAVFGVDLAEFSPDAVTSHSPTVVLRFEPTISGLAERDGTCERLSELLPRQGAVACTVGGETFDPCFAADAPGPVVVCGASPPEEQSGFAVRVAQLPVGGERRPGMTAWYLLLEDGTGCTRVREDAFNEDDDRVTYRCEDGSAIIGPVQRTSTWWGYRATADLDPVGFSAVSAAWN